MAGDETVNKITSDENVSVNETVNEKLSTMSKETKNRKKRKLQAPPKNENTAQLMNNNQIFLIIGVAGVIIASVSLYYQRKSVIKNETKTETVQHEVPEVRVIPKSDDSDLFTF